jgi:hypothetical protein
MDKSQFERETDYGAAMALAREMLERGVIDRQEFMRVDKFYADKYRPLTYVRMDKIKSGENR